MLQNTLETVQLGEQACFQLFVLMPVYNINYGWERVRELSVCSRANS